MRRSKSDPAKYARNYRKISQRHMTQYDHIDEEKEMARLRSILQNSEEHLKQADDVETSSPKNKRKRESGNHKEDDSMDFQSSILSNELLMESGNYGSENPLVVLPKKKKKTAKKAVKLTPEEIREAKALQKKTSKKLQQLEARSAQKKTRAKLYKTLEQHQVSKSALSLLASSGNVSRKDRDTKKQTLQKLLKRERAGIELSQKEKALLYPEVDVEEELLEVPESTASAANQKHDAASANKKNKGTKAQERKFRGLDGIPAGNDAIENKEGKKETAEIDEEMNESIECSKVDKPQESSDTASSGVDFAAQMLASLSKLKAETAKRPIEDSSDVKEEEQENAEPQKKYVPAAPTVLKTAVAMGIHATQVDANRRVMPIKRPGPIEKSRYDLPVSAMEFEIMDSVRNSDVTIVCGETGSGKSTQVPQFLYEGGLCLNDSDPQSSFLIGVTQPRRVAAVSTAKRVSYEMGKGDGQSIKGYGKAGNLVSYKTRYETAGVGSDTCVQFMTDGILLQEIQSDLLLRRYSVIVLDEAHERNLNTDVLIGLLSKTIPLRKQAAEEDSSLVPLKLILMSATLRVEDFTKNESLFPAGVPSVVRVPGRTFPVSIHHSKVTEVDDYGELFKLHFRLIPHDYCKLMVLILETAAYKKICKIHRKLPEGGILVFLTGKREIIRMANRLRKTLNTSSKVQQKKCTESDEVTSAFSGQENLELPRELDDEELDADDGPLDDYDEVMENDDDIMQQTKASDGDGDENLPQNAYVLPLYSLLAAEEQAKVFAPVPENHRLIVISTNIAETSITIPGISYVVDTGRQKCRNYSSGTGIASYEVMWISKAAADQRAGRAGRTGPGHCYRLYSSSLYARHMDPFALPEILTRPLEDVVLAMKALMVSNVASFPFPTPPDRSQIDGAVKLLSNIGCVDISKVENYGGDGVVTKLGEAVAKLPLGVRYAKMLLVAAQAGVLDYAIVVVSILSEASPFECDSHNEDKTDSDEKDPDKSDSLDEIDRNQEEKKKMEERKEKKRRWSHVNGDILAAMLAVGAFAYAGRGAGGASERLAGRTFCEENGLNFVIMNRIQKMRSHLAILAKNRLSTADGVATKTGGFSSKMSPPSKTDERLLVQSILSGFLDNVAILAPPGSISGDHPFSLRLAYLSCSSAIKQPLFLDRTSTVFTRDFRQLPQMICFDSLISKTAKDGTPVAVMKNITPVDSAWLGELATGSNLLSLGGPLPSPPPSYNAEKDAVVCAVSTKFGSRGWEIPPVKRVMYEALHSSEGKQSSDFLLDDSFRWFGRFLLEGKVIPELRNLSELFNDNPSIVTKRTPMPKVSMFVAALAEAGVDSASALRKHWAEKDEKYLCKLLKHWIKREHQSKAKAIWIGAVKQNINIWRSRT
jgi:ATP-dependent RNA helicase DHX37/DHR1